MPSASSEPLDGGDAQFQRCGLSIWSCVRVNGRFKGVGGVPRLRPVQPERLLRPKVNSGGVFRRSCLGSAVKGIGAQQSALR